MAVKFKGEAAEERALGAFVKLARAANTVLAYTNANLEPAGLSPSQFAVLEALYHVGPLRLGDLARRILKSSGNLTLVVDNLEKHGLVQRRKQGNDKRFILATITPAGEKLIAEIFPGHARRITQIMDRLNPAEQEQLGALCRKLGKGA
ncbi:MAG TPA: MarR family transcriptional regulator [Candidatus Saccharimonadales bacterium]|jgi:MarR family 2-MHQ and catechol resistance regulon transcriptional repressor|nr:MarR family transcriptional regulator [Candidatus Saccharimonadales bacterium]